MGSLPETHEVVNMKRPVYDPNLSQSLNFSAVHQVE